MIIECAAKMKDEKNDWKMICGNFKKYYMNPFKKGLKLC